MGSATTMSTVKTPVLPGAAGGLAPRRNITSARANPVSMKATQTSYFQTAPALNKPSQSISMNLDKVTKNSTAKIMSIESIQIGDNDRLVPGKSGHMIVRGDMKHNLGPKYNVVSYTDDYVSPYYKATREEKIARD